MKRSCPDRVTRPAIPAGVQEHYLPQNLTLSQAAQADRRELPAGTRRVGLVYRPVLLAQAEVRFLQRKYNLDYELRRMVMVSEPDRRGAVRWDDYLTEPLDDPGAGPGTGAGSKFRFTGRPIF